MSERLLRVAFGDWYMGRHGAQCFGLIVDGSGDYCSDTTRAMFEAWKAASQFATAEEHEVERLAREEILGVLCESCVNLESLDVKILPGGDLHVCITTDGVSRERRYAKSEGIRDALKDMKELALEATAYKLTGESRDDSEPIVQEYIAPKIKNHKPRPPLPGQSELF